MLEQKKEIMNKYDTSWDEEDEDAWDQKYDEWNERDWESWLLESLSFPFEVKRMEDDRDFMSDYDNNDPFTVGHVFNIEGIELEDESYGFIVNTKEGRRNGHVPLCDVEVTSKTDQNYWPIREYVVWFANR